MGSHIFLLSKISQTQEDVCVCHMFLKYIEPKDKSNRHEGRKISTSGVGVGRSVLVAIMIMILYACTKLVILHCLYNRA